jgi:SAM-dependent methyltransferase
VAGPTWVEFQAQLDRQIEPLGLAAMDALSPRPGERILDIGCGCGHSSLQLASRVGETGAVVGVDISAPMLAVARDRPVGAAIARPEFRQADAQVDALGAEAFDAAFSRFGVMFFADPVQAFANIRKALKPAGRLAFVCWRPFADNPWMRDPFAAAAPFLPPPAPVDPLAPGPFAFADAERVRSILDAAGFSGVAVRPFDAAIGGSDVETSLTLALRVGPLGSALRENPDRAEAAIGAVREVLARRLTPDGVKMPAAVWIVQASG